MQLLDQLLDLPFDRPTAGRCAACCSLQARKREKRPLTPETRKTAHQNAFDIHKTSPAGSRQRDLCLQSPTNLDTTTRVARRRQMAHADCSRIMHLRARLTSSLPNSDEDENPHSDRRLPCP